MIFTVAKEALLGAMKSAAKVVKKKSVMPQLSDVCVRASTTGLEILSTDLEVYFQASVPAEVKEEGAVTVDAARLLKFTSLVNSEEMSATTSKAGRLNLIGGGGRASIATRPAEEFPALPEIPNPDAMSMSGQELALALGKVLYAVGTDESRPAMSGVHVELGVYVATDARRIAAVSGPAAPRGAQGIWPAALAKVAALVCKDGGEATVVGGDGWVGVECGSCFVLGRMLDFDYPDWRQVIPSDDDFRAEVPKEPLIASLKRLEAMGDGGMVIDAENGELVLTSRGEVSDAREGLTAELIGEPVRAAFQTKLLEEALGSVAGDDVRLGLRDNSSPMVIREDDDVHAMMPLRLPEES